MPVKVQGEGASILYVRVTPKAARARIGGIAKDVTGQAYLKVYVVEVPEQGKANVAVVSLLSKQLRIPKSAFELVFGATDKYKRFKININADELSQSLKQAMGVLF